MSIDALDIIGVKYVWDNAISLPPPNGDYPTLKLGDIVIFNGVPHVADEGWCNNCEIGVIQCRNKPFMCGTMSLKVVEYDQ